MYKNHQINIGIDARPLQTSNRTGIPNYVTCLIKGLLNIDKSNLYRLFYNSFKDTTHHTMDLQQTNVENKIFRVPNKILTEFWDIFNFPPIESFLPQIDVFHATHFLAPPVKNSKLVVTVHDLTFVRFPEYFTKEQGARFTKRVRKSCDIADLIISDSWSTKKDIVDFFNVSPEKITVIPLAAQEHFVQNERFNSSTILDKYNISKGYFLFVGTIEPRKNLLRLIQAYNRLPKDIKKDYILILAGGKGWLNKEIYAEAERLGFLDNYVRFLGYVPDEDLPALLTNATAFVYPSLYEGFGLPPLEAMASGAPVISSNISSIPEVVGDAGILIDPFSVEEISDAMLQVVLNKDLSTMMREKGLIRASQFSWNKTATETLDVYKRVVPR